MSYTHPETFFTRDSVIAPLSTTLRYHCMCLSRAEPDRQMHFSGLKKLSYKQRKSDITTIRTEVTSCLSVCRSCACWKLEGQNPPPRGTFPCLRGLPWKNDHTSFTRMRLKPPPAGLPVLYQYFCRRKAAVFLRKAAEGLRFDCGQYGSFAVFAVYLRILRFSAVVGPQKTAA